MILGNATTLGLDLGATGVRAAEVAWQGGRPTLVRWAAADFPVEVTDWRAIDRPAMVTAIRQMLSQARMDKIKWAAHSISGESVALQYFNFPKLMSEDVAEAVRIEAETARYRLHLTKSGCEPADRSLRLSPVDACGLIPHR